MRLFTIGVLTVFFSLPIVYCASANWQTIALPKILLHYQAIDAPVAQAIAQRAEQMYAALTNTVGFTPRSTIYVYLCPTAECFRQQQPGSTRLPEWAVGVAYPQLNRIVMRSALMPGEGERIRPVEIFQHELAHIVLEQALADHGGAPRWLSEGFSMYAAAQWTTGGQRTLEEVALRDQFLPLTFLTASFPDNEEAARIAYAQSFSVVAFLLKSYGKYAFQDFILNLRNGMDTNSALLHATGRSLKSVELEWQNALRLRYSWWMYAIRYGGFWFALSMLFVVAYLIKRIKMRRIQAGWESEDTVPAWEDGPED